MSGPTVLNPHLNTTVLNPALEAATVLNPALAAPAALLPAGTVLAGQYQILAPLDAAAGEADLYLCQWQEQQAVAKVYRRRQAAKPEVAALLRSIRLPGVAPLLDTGEHQGLPFEILPYYKNGSLQGRTFPLARLKETVIPAINEALRALHSQGILHKDLKPSNIMLGDDGQQLALIDFGISSVADPGSTVLVTHTGMTPEYAAPETFRSLFLEESDYYSFGITLYELYCGYTPYKNMSAEEIARFTAVQRLPFPQEMPQDLQDLISALTYFDITNRRKKENPNRRWTYEEVKNWCAGLQQALPGEGAGARAAMPPYPFLKQEYTDLPALVTALATHWKEGKKQLYRGLLSAYFTPWAPKLAGHCLDAEDQAARTTGQDDVIFWRLIYRLCPELKGFYWLGQSCESLPALGREMLDRLWAGDPTRYGYWSSILDEKLLTGYLERVGAENEALTAAARALEIVHGLEGRTLRERTMDYYTMAYLLSGQRIFAIDGRQLKSVPELTAYMKELLADSYVRFEDFCHRLIAYDDTLDAQFEAWLIALGKRDALDAWRVQLAQ